MWVTNNSAITLGNLGTLEEEMFPPNFTLGPTVVSNSVREPFYIL